MKRTKKSKFEKQLSYKFMKKSKKAIAIASLFAVTSGVAMPITESAVKLNATQVKEDVTQDKTEKNNAENQKVTGIKFLNEEDFNKIKSLQGGKVRFGDGTEYVGERASGTVAEHFKAGASTYTARWTSDVPSEFGYDSTWWAMGQPNYLTVGSTIVFCIDPGTAAIPGTSASGTTDPTKTVFHWYSDTQQKNMKLASMYAMKLYNETGNKDYLYAGQFVVWQYAGWNVSGIDSSLTGEMQTIKNEMSTHNVKPSFMSSANKVHELIYNSSTKQYELTLTDSNKVFEKRYEQDLLGSDEVATFGAYTVDGRGADDTIKVTATSHTATPSAKIKATYKPYSGTQYFYAPSGQDMMGAGANDVSAYFSFKIKPALGSSNFKKVDGETGEDLSGAVFGLYSDSKATNKIAEATSDKDGNVVFKDIVDGEYYLKELKAPVGYELNNTIFKETIQANKNVTWTFGGHEFYNDEIKGKITLHKVEDDSNLVGGDTTNENLEGAEFTITDTATNKVVQTIKTDKNGNATSDFIPYGTYKVEETKAPNGYINSGYSETVKIDESNEIVKLNGGKAIVNEEMSGTLDLTKVEDNSNLVNGDKDNNPLKGAEFTIYDKDLKAVQVITTDENGYAKSGQLQLGTYTVKETKAPAGYENTGFEAQVTIKNGTTVHVNEGKAIVNKEMGGYASVTKVEDNSMVVTGDEENNPLPEAEFTIYDEKDSPIQRIVTDKEGHAETGKLAFGNYYAKETKAPAGYNLDPTKYEFTIDENNEHISASTEPIVNEVIHGRVALRKIGDLNGNNKQTRKLTRHYEHDYNQDGEISDNEQITYAYDTIPLGGVEFGVYTATDKSAKGGELVDSFFTDEKGFGRSHELGYGKYYVQEINSVDKYHVDKTKYYFSINENGKVEFLNSGLPILNTLKQGRLDLMKVSNETDYNESEPMSDVGFDVYKDSNANGKLDEGEEENVVDHITTNNQGHAISKKLTVGAYLVKETNTNIGYNMSTEVYPVTVEADKTVSVNDNNSIVNDHIQGKVKFHKTDEHGTNIADVELTLYNESDEPIGRVVTDENGFAESEALDFGKYYAIETNAPDSVIMSDEKYEFEINDETVEHEVTINVVNDLIEAYIEVNKVDRKTGEDLSGAEFNVIDETGKVVDKLKTSYDGTAKSKKLPYGTYTIKEVKAPTNYQINSKDQTVTIGKDDNEKVVYTTVEDDKKQAEVCTGLDEDNKEIIETVDIDKVEESKGDCEVKEQPNEKVDQPEKEVEQPKEEVIITMPETSTNPIKQMFNKLFK